MKKTIVTAAILASGLLFSFNPANASSIAKNNIEIISGTENSSVLFRGASEDAYLFNVKVANAQASKFVLTVKSEDGEVLYSKAFTDVKFDRTIKLLKNESESRYYFTISSSDKSLNQDFVINATTRVVNDVEVSKL